MSRSPNHWPLAFAAAALLNTRSAQAASGRLLVYLHVAVKQRALQGLLGAALADVSITTVGRIADFKRAFQDGTDAVLTLPVVLAAQGLSPSLRGFRQGAPDERYSLVGAGSPPDPEKVGTVGALDLLGREGTNVFVGKLLGRNSSRVERVSKVEDLLPLIQMQRVDAVLLPTRLFGELQATSRLGLAPRELEPRVGLPAAVAIGSAGAPLLNAVKQLPRDLSKLLGVDEWR